MLSKVVDTSIDIASFSGTRFGKLTTLTLASPGIILDFLVQNTAGRCLNLNKNYTLATYDFPAKVAYKLGFFTQDDESDAQRIVRGKYKYHIYKGGFFAKYPLGIVAGGVGTVVNFAVSATVFLASVSIGLTLALGYRAVCGALMTAGIFALAALASVAIFVLGMVQGPNKTIDIVTRKFNDTYAASNPYQPIDNSPGLI